MPRTSRGRPNLYDSRTLCSCERPLKMDESALGLGVNCLLCGRSVTHRLTPDERDELRAAADVRRSKRRIEVP